jgi:NAD(P)-dependent dehydrogenase (short-subunit alcohol dehydrogenase family)
MLTEIITAMQGKIALVVGATGGIGGAVTQELVQAGAKVVAAGRNHDRLAQLVQKYPSVYPVATDITDFQQVHTLFQAVSDRYGSLDMVINCAGAGIMKQFNKLEPADLDWMVDVNLKGCFYVTQTACQFLKEKRSGHICNVIGILGKHSMPMATAYCASKFGAVGLTKCIAEEVKRLGIKITIVYLGGVDTPFWDHANLKVDRAKMLSPQQAARSIMFALSCDPVAVPMEINIQPESHLFF